MELNVLNVAKIIMSLVGKNKSISSIKLSNIIYFIWCECKMLNFDFEATFYSVGNTGLAICKELRDYNSNEYLYYSDFKSVRLTKDDMRLKENYRDIIKEQIFRNDAYVDDISLEDKELTIIDSYKARRFALYCMIFNINDEYNIIDSDAREVLKKRYNILESCINLPNEMLYDILNGFILGYFSNRISLAERIIRYCSKLSAMDLHFEEEDDEFYIDGKLLENDEQVYLNVTVFDIASASKIVPEYDILKEVIHDSRALFYAL